MTALLGLRNLSKRFGYRTILQELNLDIQAGECVLLLGNNGAGKSTLLRLCATLLKPQQGQILYEGMPIDEDKHRYLRDMGSIAHESRLYGDLTPRENLHLFGVLYELKTCHSEFLEHCKMFNSATPSTSPSRPLAVE